jgi:soluble lytic murein transglycosylase-like protein
LFVKIVEIRFFGRRIYRNTEGWIARRNPTVALNVASSCLDAIRLDSIYNGTMAARNTLVNSVRRRSTNNKTSRSILGFIPASVRMNVRNVGASSINLKI